jgi:hypothetical protein
MIRSCIRCKETFDYALDNRRKYCDDCRVLQHRDESKIYQRELRLCIKKSTKAWEKMGL